jgi:hypothetical protein
VSTRRRYDGLEGFLSRLASVMSVSVTNEGYLVIAGGLGPTQRFVPAGEPDVFRPATGPAGAGGMVRFERDDDRVERVVAMPVAFERVGLLYRPLTLLSAAGLTAFTSLAIVIGFFARLSHETIPESRGQNLARRSQLAAAAVWLVGIVTFALWITGLMADLAGVFRHWPGPLLSTASAAGLLASALTLLGALLLPAVWRDASDWTAWRKGRYTLALAIFAAFAVLLGAWGALEPWAT